MFKIFKKMFTAYLKKFCKISHNFFKNMKKLGKKLKKTIGTNLKVIQKNSKKIYSKNIYFRRSHILTTASTARFA